MEKTTFKVVSFGCPVSQYEAEALKALLQEAGFKEAAGPAGVYIINSCVVTAAAAAEARRAVRRAKRENPGSLAVIAGCYPQVYHREIEEMLPEADIIIGTTGRRQLPEIIKARLEQGGGPEPENLVQEHDGKELYEHLPVTGHYTRIRPVVKIQEGCDEHCTYCIVAQARGRPRSLEPARVMEEVEHFVRRGYREVILAGNHLGIYGRDIPGWDLARLLAELDQMPGRFRIRLSYIEPMDVEDDLLQVMAAGRKICPHLYLPLQSGSDRILKKMGRRYSSRQYARLVNRARELIPSISIFTDIIVGFPGEAQEDFLATVQLARELEFSRLHVFPFSPRPGTPAERLGEPVRPDIKKQRVDELRALDGELAAAFYAAQAGRILEVLPERREKHAGATFGVGFSGNYARVLFPLPGAAPLGELVQVRVTRADGDGVYGELLR